MAGPRPLFSLATVLSLLLLLFTAQGAQGQLGAAIQPPVAEEPVDLDGNGLYDELRLLVTLDVLIAGPYRVIAYLTTSSAGPFPAIIEQHFAQGVQELVVPVPGDIVHGLGDGPYQLEVSIGDVRADYLVIDRHETQTMPYLAIEFEPPFISFRAPFVDRVTDLDGNGLWDG